MLDEKQVQEADAAVTRAVTAFVSEFESMWGRWENVAPGYSAAQHELACGSLAGRRAVL
jgi:hypothetical protein